MEPVRKGQIMKRKAFLIIAVLIAVAVLAAGCQEEAQETFPGEDETYASELESLGSVNRFAGVVTASGETKIEKENERTVAEVLVSPGEDVEEGQVLFTYDSEQAQLNYDKAKLELDQLNLSLQSYNDQKYQLENEKYNAPESEQLSYTLQIQETDTSIRETSYNISLKEKEVEKLEKSLNNLEVTSPIDGKVQSINEDGAVSADGSPLPFIMLMNTGTYRVKAYINEINAMELFPGAPVIIRSRIDDSTWNGTIESVDFDNPVTTQQGYDMGDNTEVSSSSRYPFYVTLDNADGLILGQHVFVELNQYAEGVD